MRPGDDAALVLGSAVVEAWRQGDSTVTVVSVGPGFAGGIGAAPELTLQLSAAGVTVQMVLPLSDEPAFNATGATTYSVTQALVPYDSANARKFGLAFTQDVRMPVTYGGQLVPIVRTSGAVTVAARRLGAIDDTSG